MTIRTALRPDHFATQSFRGSATVMIDVLRASTSIIHGLQHGARCFLPCSSIGDARSLSAAREDSLLGGERGGVKIDGFDLGNSPSAYSEDVVRDRPVVITTTNGTKALHHASEASELLVGAFVNRSAIVGHLTNAQLPVILLCAGTDGQITAEDVLFAGSVVAELTQTPEFQNEAIDDASRIAMDFFLANSQNPDSLLAAARQGLGGQNLIKLGFDADIELAMTMDLFSAVPRFDPRTGEITKVV